MQCRKRDTPTAGSFAPQIGKDQKGQNARAVTKMGDDKPREYADVPTTPATKGMVLKDES